MVRLDLYPGWVDVAGLSLGAYFVAGRFDGVAAGVTLPALPIGPGVARPGSDALHRL